MFQKGFRRGTKRHSKNKLNNAGMSLVEVIISITILALVAIPVMRSLTTAMYYNAKARTRQSVTLSAESLMETFKGYRLEELQSWFQQAAAGDETAKAALGIPEADGFVYPSDLGADTLTFGVNGLESDDGKTSCDIEVTATKQAAVDLMEIDNILPARDAIFRADISYSDTAWEKAVADFQTNYQDAFLAELNSRDERDYGLTQSDIDLSCLTLYQRELVFRIANDGSKDVVTAKMVYVYYIKEHSYYEKVVTSSPGDSQDEEGASESATEAESETVTLEERKFNYPENTADYFKIEMPLSAYAPAGTGEYTVYTNPIEGGVHPLQRLMIYYYPAYDLERDETILVKNEAGLDLDCYLIKQKNAGLTNAQLDVKETSYKPGVNCTGSGNVILYHNLNTNLGGNSFAGGAGHITTFAEVKDYAGDHFFKVQKALVYKLELKVSANGSQIASFEGTMNEYMDN